MKTLLNTSLERTYKYLLVFAVLSISSFAVSAQLVVTITSPGDGDCHCLELADEVTFAASVTDGGVAIPPSSLAWSWTGPDGYTSSVPAPEVVFDDADQSGTYTVVVTSLAGTTAEDEVMITVKPLLDLNCPASVTVTPDLNPALSCPKNLEDYTFDVENIATCIGAPSVEYAIQFINEDGTVRTPDAGGPITGDITGDDTYPNTELDYLNLDFGIHQIVVDILDDADDSILKQCITTVRVLESVNNVACNDEINLTLTDDCVGTITPDMILQGDYCFDNFQISMDGDDGMIPNDGVIGPAGQITLTEPGTYVISVTNQSGNSCWGSVVAEDKSRPVLDCPDNLEVWCSQEYNQGLTICDFDKAVITAGTYGTGTNSIILPIATNLTTATQANVKEVRLFIDANVDDISGLALELTDPTSTTTVTLIDLGDVDPTTTGTPGLENDPDNYCDGQNISICLADLASYDESWEVGNVKSYSDFFGQVNCGGGINAFFGNYTPFSDATAGAGFGGFAEFAGAPGAGNWTLDLINSSGAAMTDVNIELHVTLDVGSFVNGNDLVVANGCSSSVNVETEDETISDNCTAEGYWEVVNRTWTATNDFNDLSSTCEQEVKLKAWTIADIIWPKDRDGVHHDVIECSDLYDPVDWSINTNLVDSDTLPLPIFSGRPVVPFGDNCGNLQYEYTDLVFPICLPISKKIIRKWTVLDWCTGEHAEYDQVIKIEDRNPIQMTCAPDTDNGIPVINADGTPLLDGSGAQVYAWPGVTDADQCAGDWDVVAPVVISNACNAHEFTYSVEFLIADEDGMPPVDGEYVKFDAETGARVIEGADGSSETIENLPAGPTWLRYTVEDNCGNTGFCFTEVRIVDRAVPNPVCIEFTVVAIGDDGCAYLPAESLDNHSWDNCEVVDREISRTNDINNDATWSERLKYTCGCMMDEEDVYLRVTDAEGNRNMCRVRVEIQNNIVPTVSGGPDNMDIECTSGAIDLFATATAGVGEFTFEANCPETPGFEINFTRGDGSAINEGDMLEPGECGEGSMTIKYVITDDCGNQIGPEYNQMMQFTNDFDGFDVTQWPLDTELTDCEGMTDPERLASQFNADNIRYSSSQCNSNVAITHDDQIFPDVDDACFKILREWTVIDWCIVNALGSVEAGRRSHTQVIKVSDDAAPVITNLPAVVTGDDPSCQYLLTEESLGDYTLTDNCTELEDIVISYEVHDPTVSDDPIPTADPFNKFYASGTTVTILVRDHCDNVNSYAFVIVTEDPQAPTPYCQSQVVTGLSATGDAEIWVSDFSLGAQDNCDVDVEDYFLNEFDEKVQVLTYSCDDIPNGVIDTVLVTVYFEDDAGNVNSCIGSLVIQDNQDVCPDETGSREISGDIHTEDFQMVENVKVDVMRNNTMMASSTTNESGSYNFAFEGDISNYQVRATRDDNYLNGVSTVDLVIIQRHILGINRFTSPYKIIASDINNSGTINGLDLVELRKLILGIYTELPQNESWRFPVKDQNFADPNRPFPFSENFYAGNVENQTDQDFIGVKIGDVNGSVTASLTGNPVDLRSDISLDLTVEDMGLMEGNMITVPFYADNMDEVVGFQTTLSYNPAILDYVATNGIALEFTEGNLGLHSVSEGYITLSWNDLEPVSVDADQALFELQFMVKSSGNLSEQLFLSSAMTASEAYDNELNSMEVNLRYDGADLGDFVLYQNIPNPFAENTEIRFNLPGSSKVTFTVYDVEGREILRKTSNYELGNHTILLNREDLNSTGIMYYRLETAYGTASRKMIQLR